MKVSPTLQALYPAGVVGVEMRAAGDPKTLHPEEAAVMSRAAPKRIQEFSAGRLCARFAMQAFGVVDHPLRMAADRQPLWPEHLIGSISHTTGLCVAVVAEMRRFRAIGVDCEGAGQVHEELWPSICNPGETDWLRSLPEVERAAAAALIFSTKEAFYKCQYPLTGEWLDFHDLDVRPLTWRGAAAGGAGGAVGVLVRATRKLAIAGMAEMPVTGQYVFRDGFVTTGVCFPAAPP